MEQVAVLEIWPCLELGQNTYIRNGAGVRSFTVGAACDTKAAPWLLHSQVFLVMCSYMWCDCYVCKTDMTVRVDVGKMQGGTATCTVHVTASNLALDQI